MMTPEDRAIWNAHEMRTGSNAKWWDAVANEYNLSNLPLVLKRLSNGRIGVAEAVRNLEEAQRKREALEERRAADRAWLQFMTDKFGHGGI